jgi:hypothetical protein
MTDARALAGVRVKPLARRLAEWIADYEHDLDLDLLEERLASEVLAAPEEVGLTRYTPIIEAGDDLLDGGNMGMVTSPRGEWVRHDDAAAALAAERRHAEGVGLTQGEDYDAANKDDWSPGTSRNAWIADARGLRAALAAKDAEIAAEKARADKAISERRAMEQGRDDWFLIARACQAKVATLKEACEIVASKRQCLDNLMSHKEVAEKALQLATLSTPSPPAIRWRHVKSGTEYEVIGAGKMQAFNWHDTAGTIDMREVVIYRSLDDGSLWARPIDEFYDGRFEQVFTWRKR